MARRFDIIEPARDPRTMLALLMLVPTMVVLAVVYVLVKPTPPPFLPVPILAIMALQIVLISRWIDRREVGLEGGVLRMVAGNSKLDVAVTDLDLDRARVLRLDEHPEWKPFLRTGGIGMPGLSLGWFRTRSLVRLYCVMTDRQRLLVLPSRDGKQAVLLSLKRPDDLLAALREANDRGARGR